MSSQDRWIVAYSNGLTFPGILLSKKWVRVVLVDEGRVEVVDAGLSACQLVQEHIWDPYYLVTEIAADFT
jgi:hypothetical protein